MTYPITSYNQTSLSDIRKKKPIDFLTRTQPNIDWLPKDTKKSSIKYSFNSILPFFPVPLLKNSPVEANSKSPDEAMKFRLTKLTW